MRKRESQTHRFITYGEGAERMRNIGFEKRKEKQSNMALV